MSDRKNKRASISAAETLSGETPFVIEAANVEIGSGYTLAVSYDESNRPIVDIKTIGQVDIAQLRRNISRTFPNAQIRKLCRADSVTIVRASAKKKKHKK
jgi:hypothetical protein